MSQGLLAIDIGGTKLAAGIVTMEGGVVSRARQPTPPNGDAEAIYAALLASVSAAIADGGAGCQIQGIGIGSGGPMRAREGLVSPLNMPGWRDFPLVARLRDDLGLTAVLDNDAKAFALGEYRYGAGQGHPDMMGVVVSTGVGGGIISAGTLLHGRTLNGGHVGHLVAEPDGPRCACGGRGCVEAIASGPSIVRLVRAELARGRESALQEMPPETIMAQDVAQAAR
ncbi:MAG: ROK family protein, partial [Acidobacteriota bacterium]|nr:ROK family protein [Acidobacteriota bacterium]